MDDPNFLKDMNPHTRTKSLRRFLQFGGVTAVFVLALTLVSLLSTPVPAAAPIFSGGGPADAATAVALDASVSIVADTALLETSLYGTWSVQAVGNAAGDELTAVKFASANDGWIFGTNSASTSAVIRKTVDGGQNWTGQTATASTTYIELEGADFASTSVGWVVGGKSNTYDAEEETLSSPSGLIFKTANGGTTWTEQTNSATVTLTKIFAADASTAFAVGEAGTILKTSDGGTTWSALTNGASSWAPSAANIKSIFCISTSTCWAGGREGSTNGFVIQTTNGGTSWSSDIGQTGDASNNNDLYFFDANTGFADTLYTTNNGTSWTQRSPLAFGDLMTASDFVSTSQGWIVSEQGKVYMTLDTGTNWTAQTLSGLTASSVIKDVDAVNGATAYLVTDLGQVYRHEANVLLRANTGNAQAGAASGNNLCTALTLTGGTTISCTNANLTAKTWYSLTVTTSVLSSGSDPLATTVTRAFRTIGAPTVASQSITSGAVNVSTTATVSATFDEALSIANVGTTTWMDAVGVMGRGSSESISCADASTCWRVDDDGDIQKTSDGGARWELQYDGATALYAITMIDVTSGYAVGSGGLLLRTDSGGAEWSTQTSGTVVDLRKIACADVGTCWISGYFTDGGSEIVLIRTTNGGSSWSSLSYAPTLPQFGGTAYSLSPVNGSTAWLVGGKTEDGIINYDYIAKTTDGVTWTEQTNARTSAVSGNPAGLFGVAAIDANTAYAVGSGGFIAKTVDGGTTWTQQTSGTSLRLSDIECASTSVCYVSIRESADGGLKTTDGGSTWTSLGVPGIGGGVESEDLSVVDANTVYLLDKFNISVRKTSNGGVAWTTSGGGVFGDALGGKIAYDVAMPDDTTVYVAGFGGVVLKSTDAGASWTSLSVASSTQSLRSIACPSTTLCLAAGDANTSGAGATTIYRTSNGGATWSGVEPVTVFGFGSVTDVYCLDTSTCWASTTSGGSTRFYLTTNGGTSWGDATTSPSVSGNTYTAFADANIGWIVANSGAIHKSTNGGNAWSVQTSGTANNLLGIAAPSTTIAYAVGLSGTILKTIDGGSTWTAQTSGTSVSLNDVACSSTTNCWALGGSRTILRTTDGSAWSADTVPSTNADFPIATYVAGAVRSLSSGVAIGQDNVFDAIDLSITLRALTPNSSTGVATGRNLCTPQSGLSNSNTTLTCAHEALSPGTWYQVVYPGGASGIVDSTSVYPLASNVTTVFRTAFNSDFSGFISGAGFGSAVAQGYLSAVGSSTAATSATAQAATNITATVGTGVASALLPKSAVMTRTGGGTFDTTALAMTDATSSVSNVPGTNVAAIQYGVPGVGLSFSAAVSISVPLSTSNYDGQTMNVFRTSSTDFSSASDPLTTCVPSSGVCSFTTTTGSYFAIAAIGSPSTGDLIPPSLPTALSATLSDAGVTLTWQDPSDPDLASLRVIRYKGSTSSAAQLLSTVSKGTQTFLDRTAALSSSYIYEVQARDASGNTTQPGTQLAVTIPSLEEIAEAPPVSLVTLPEVPVLPDPIPDPIIDEDPVSEDPEEEDAGAPPTPIDIIDTPSGGETEALPPEVEIPPEELAELPELVEESEPELPEEPEQVDGDDDGKQEIIVKLDAPCTLSSRQSAFLRDSFARSQARKPTTQRDLDFLCALRSDPGKASDPTVTFPEFRNLVSENIAIKNFVNFFRRPPSLDFNNQPLTQEAAARDWWAVKYMAYHLRLAPAARDIVGERRCLKLFIDRDVDLYKNGTKVRKLKGQPPMDVFDFDFIRACTYSGAKFIE
jgi:photosystem II stability/assembly factor-like uncharacterized protein